MDMRRPFFMRAFRGNWVRDGGSCPLVNPHRGASLAGAGPVWFFPIIQGFGPGQRGFDTPEQPQDSFGHGVRAGCSPASCD